MKKTKKETSTHLFKYALTSPIKKTQSFIRSLVHSIIHSFFPFIQSFFSYLDLFFLSCNSSFPILNFISQPYNDQVLRPTITSVRVPRKAIILLRLAKIFFLCKNAFKWASLLHRFQIIWEPSLRWCWNFHRSVKERQNLHNRKIDSNDDSM